MNQYHTPEGNTEAQGFHFFASNFAEWKASESLTELCDWMKKSKQSHNVYYVPLPFSAEYDINFYQPQVAGVLYLGSYDRKNKLISDK